MKRFFCCFLATIMMLSTIASVCVTASAEATDGPIIKIESVDAKPGDTVDVAVSVYDNPGVVAVNFGVRYDKTVMTLVDVQDTALLAGFTNPNPNINPVLLRWSDARATKNNTKEGVIAILSFEILDTAKNGRYDIEVSFDDPRNKILSIGETVFDLIERDSTGYENGGVRIIDGSASSVLVPDERIGDGQSFGLEIQLENNSGVESIDFDLEFDDELLFVTGITDAGLLSGFEGAKEPYTSPMRFTYSGSGENVLSDGTLLTVTFKVREGAPTQKTFVEAVIRDAKKNDGEGGLLPSDTVGSVGQVTVIDKITAVFDAGEGSGAPKPVEYEFKETVKIPETVPTREGYDFGGWVRRGDEKHTVYQAGADYSLQEDSILDAVWSLRRYPVIFELEGGEGDFPQAEKEHFSVYNIPEEIPTKTGYDFLGWTTVKGGETPEYAQGDEYSVEAPLTLYAIWSIKTYKITYDLCGGSGKFPEQTKIYGVKLTLNTDIPKKIGYNFLGWATSETSKTPIYQAGSTYVANAGATLYAVWELKIFDIVFDANEGDGAPETVKKPCFTDITLPDSVPEREGHEFLGWAKSKYSGEPDYMPGDLFSANEDMTLYALWRAEEYEIVYDANGGEGAPEKQTKTYGQRLTLSQVTPQRNGYIFLGWSEDKDAETEEYQPGAYFFGNGDTVLFAVWKRKTYKIIFNANGGEGAPDPQYKNSLEPLIIPDTVPTREGYDFLGWAESSAASSAKYQPGGQYVKDEARSLFAVWKLKSYTITFDANGGEGELPDPIKKKHGETVVIPPNEFTKEGHDFLGWATEKDAIEACAFPGEEFSENGDMTLYAVFRIITYPVSFGIEGGEGEIPDQIKEYGKDLEITEAIPEKTGYDFIGWAREKEAAEPDFRPGDVYSENAELHLFALWKIKTFEVSFDTNGMTKAPETLTKTYGESLILPGCADTEEYIFLGWALDEGSTVPDYKTGEPFDLEKDTVLYAVWERAFICGDVDGNKVVDENDAVRLGRYLGGWKLTISEKAADVNADGVIDESDSVLLGRYFGGWDVSLGSAK